MFTTSSGILKGEAYSDYQTDRNYKDNIYRYAYENLPEIDKESIKDLLEIFDQDMLLDTSIKLLTALNIDIIHEQLLEEIEISERQFLIILLIIPIIFIFACGNDLCL